MLLVTHVVGECGLFIEGVHSWGFLLAFFHYRELRCVDTDLDDTVPGLKSRMS